MLSNAGRHIFCKGRLGGHSSGPKTVEFSPGFLKSQIESAQKVHWQIFHRKDLVPRWENGKDISMEEISRAYRLKDANQANSRLVTVERRFERVLWRRLRDLTDSDDAAEREFNEIMRFLSEKGAKF